MAQGKTCWVGSFLARVPASPNPRKSIMIDSYWDLYVTFVNKCIRDNRVNDVDPHHYEMEWNHFLPQCAFSDQPMGQWLTKPQHAIASALQTLALKRNCMCRWHKKFLPSLLLETAWPLYCKAAKQANVKGRSVAKELGVGAAYDPVKRHEMMLKALSPSAQAKKKETYQRIKHQSGVTNSQYGTMWITNGEENKKIKKTDPVPKGYKPGRKV